MADTEYSASAEAQGRAGPAHSPDALAQGHSLISWTNTAGALVSLSLIAGIGVWGYDLMMRDVSGLPVVRAAKTEMRVRPDDPGGQLATHQGLSVNEIAATGGVPGPADEVRLAPPGVALAHEDQPVAVQMAGMTDTALLRSTETALDEARKSEPSMAGRAALAPVDEAAIKQIVLELTAQADEGSEASQSATDSTETTLAMADTAAMIITDAVETPGLRSSVRPRLRPKDGIARVRPVAFTPEPREIDPAAIPSGTRLAQLGAFDSPEVARAEWNRMQGMFGDILDGKSRVVQKAISSGRTFYRLRAMGFVDLADARRFCSAVKAEGVDCIPVEVK